MFAGEERQTGQRTLRPMSLTRLRAPTSEHRTRTEARGAATWGAASSRGTPPPSCARPEAFLTADQMPEREHQTLYARYKTPPSPPIRNHPSRHVLRRSRQVLERWELFVVVVRKGHVCLAKSYVVFFPIHISLRGEMSVGLSLNFPRSGILCFWTRFIFLVGSIAFAWGPDVS